MFYMKTKTYKVIDISSVDITNVKNLALIIPTFKGPTSKPIVFSSISDGLEYFKKYNN